MTNKSIQQSTVTDEELIKRYQDGDLYAYDLIVRRYKDQLLNFAYRFLGNLEESEDVVQETFLRLYKNRHAYKQIAKFSTWIYTIAGNLAKTELRKRKRRKLVSISELGFEEKEFELEDNKADTEQQADSQLKEKIIQNAIEDLPFRFKQVIILRDIQELSYEDISSILRIPLGTVKSRVNRARQRLQVLLKDLMSQENRS
ncbi:MAG TPA: sigma-70 family RNA polymerase sigma factor [bacterium]|nr:sigma-70 family RNA polymerase sigma factor [bacterium]HPN44788.1 sigma-70 family RNA polymerase sigma factor [bacterium]